MSIKKKISLFISLSIFFSVLNVSALTNMALTGFTHPEIGEFIIYGLENDMPFFTIYGFTQYKVINLEEPYRGIQIFKDNKPVTLEDALNKIIDSINDEDAANHPVVFEHTGLLQEFNEQLKDLPKKDLLKAITLLAGFEGIKALPELQKIKEFSEIDLKYLEENYIDYTIQIDSKTYPFRILMFYIEEENWEESYFERYNFIKKENNWIVLNISKEYASDYRMRNKYIHGLPGMTLRMYEEIEHDAFRGHNWFSTQDSVITVEKVTKENNTVSVENIEVYRLPADLTYTYQNNWLSKIEYKLHLEQSYYSAIISLYLRYYDPIIMLPNGNMTWELPDMTIELIYRPENSLLVFTPRVDLSIVSAG